MPEEYKKRKPVQYLNKDFGSFREKLIDYAKQYFPDTYNDFNESSPGMMFIEMASYVGDVLSFYIDHQAKETMLMHAEERSNVVDLAKSLGYKAKAIAPAYVDLDIYQILPVLGSGTSATPDYRYALKIEQGMVVASAESPEVKFSTLRNLDFKATGSESDTTTVYTIDDSTGDPTSYLIKKTMPAISGELKTQAFTFESPKKFDRVRIDSTKVIKIDSVNDGDGNKWYEVPYLAQDTIFDEIANDRTNNPHGSGSSEDAPYLLKLRRTARRFTTGLAFNNKTELHFGAGISADPDELIIPSPETIGNTLDRGNTSTLDVAFDPANMMCTRAYGQAPANTTLTVSYLEGGGLASNVGSGILNKVESVTYSMDEDGLDGDTLATSKSSLAVTNTFGATGGRNEETVEEIRQNALGAYATQNRAVTKEDYLSRVYTMPARFGSIAKAFMVQNDFVNNEEDPEQTNPLALDLYILAYDGSKTLTNCNRTTKENLQTYLGKFRMLTDAINIRNGFVVNIGVDFEVLTLPAYNGKEVLAKVLDRVRRYFSIEKWQFNQPIMLASLSAEMDKVDGVQTISNITIKNNVSTDSGYSGNIYDIDAATYNNIIYTSQDPMIFEIKYPDKDVRGKIIG